ncbi:MAG: ankyrin repeat domain-containing protein [Chlamydiota bacterium]
MGNHTNEMIDLKFSYKTVSYEDYKKRLYKPEGWIGRKIFAIPKTLIFGTLSTIGDIAKAILLDLPRVLFGNVRPLKETVFRFTRNLEFQFGRIATIFNDRWGKFMMLDSELQTRLYDFAVSPPKKQINFLEKLLRNSKKDAFFSSLIINNLKNVKSITTDCWRQDTLLMVATRYGAKGCVKLLLRKGADVNGKNKQNETALYLALRNNDKEIADLLLEKALSGENLDIDTINRPKPNLETLLMLAAKNGYKEIVTKLIEKGAKVTDKSNNPYITRINCEETALYLAISRGHEEIANLLIKNGALDENDHLNKEYDYSQKTLLMAAAEKGFGKLVDLLLEKGAKVSESTVYGETAFSLAAENGNVEIAMKLVKKGALDQEGLINKKYGLFQKTLLMFAAEKGCKKLVTLLVEKGAKLTKMSSNDSTALSLAIENGHEEIALQLIKNGSLDKADHLNASYGYSNKTLLMAATEKGLTKVVRELLDRGAELTVGKRYLISTDNLLDIALRGANEEIVLLFMSKGLTANRPYGEHSLFIGSAEKGFKKVIEQLIASGVDVNVKANNGSNALHFAAQNGHLELVKLLIEKGVPINSKGVKGKTALDFAKDSGYGKKEDMKKVVEYLSQLMKQA